MTDNPHIAFITSVVGGSVGLKVPDSVTVAVNTSHAAKVFSTLSSNAEGRSESKAKGGWALPEGKK